MMPYHPGVPIVWAVITWVAAVCIACWALWSPLPSHDITTASPRKSQYFIERWITTLLGSQKLLLMLKIGMVILFFFIITDGLYGSPNPQQNIATQWTWNLWWAGLIVGVFFLGSSWCAVCPWESIASWLTRLNMMGKPNAFASLNLPVPSWLRSVWPAALLLLFLTWLELGYDITTNPYATALLALLILVITTASHALFERKAFCRYVCPVGRTIGFYAQLSPATLRPLDPAICVDCTTLDCYHGNKEIEPCPTGLVMKNLKENTYCTSCGNCVRSCPQGNVAWQLRPISHEASQDARPRLDEACFVIILLTLATLHGLTMMPVWDSQIQLLSGWLGGKISPAVIFLVVLLLTTLISVLVYTGMAALTSMIHAVKFKRVFISMAFMLLPLAFSYHISHNLSHLARENSFFGWLVYPSGITFLPVLQVILMLGGFWLSMLILRHRGSQLNFNHSWQLAPFGLMALSVTTLHLWMLSQSMVMRF